MGVMRISGNIMIEKQRNLALFEQIMLSVAIKVLICKIHSNIIISVKGGMGRTEHLSCFGTLFGGGAPPINHNKTCSKKFRKVNLFVAVRVVFCDVVPMLVHVMGHGTAVFLGGLAIVGSRRACPHDAHRQYARRPALFRQRFAGFNTRSAHFIKVASIFDHVHRGH